MQYSRPPTPKGLVFDADRQANDEPLEALSVFGTQPNSVKALAVGAGTPGLSPTATDNKLSVDHTRTIAGRSRAGRTMRAHCTAHSVMAHSVMTHSVTAHSMAHQIIHIPIAATTRCPTPQR